MTVLWIVIFVEIWYAILEREGWIVKYTDLVFDLYGTLVDIHTEENEFVWEHTAL